MRRIFLAIIILAFAINEANAQRRRTNNGNERTRVTRTTTPKRVVTRRVVRPRVVIGNRFNRFNTGYYRNFNRTWNGFYFPFRQFNYVPTPETVLAQEEALENALENIRAKRLAKYILKPNKRNKKKLIKYNILTGREADDITP